MEKFFEGQSLFSVRLDKRNAEGLILYEYRVLKVEETTYPSNKHFSYLIDIFNLTTKEIIPIRDLNIDDYDYGVRKPKLDLFFTTIEGAEKHAAFLWDYSNNLHKQLIEDIEQEILLFDDLTKKAEKADLTVKFKKINKILESIVANPDNYSEEGEFGLELSYSFLSNSFHTGISVVRIVENHGEFSLNTFIRNTEIHHKEELELIVNSYDDFCEDFNSEDTITVDKNLSFYYQHPTKDFAFYDHIYLKDLDISEDGLKNQLMKVHQKALQFINDLYFHKKNRFPNYLEPFSLKHLQYHLEV